MTFFLIFTILISIPIIIIDVKKMIKGKHNIKKIIIAISIGFLFCLLNDIIFYFIFRNSFVLFLRLGVIASISSLFGPAAGFFMGIFSTCLTGDLYLILLSGLFGLLIGLFKYKLNFSNKNKYSKTIILYIGIYFITQLILFTSFIDWLFPFRIPHFHYFFNFTRIFNDIQFYTNIIFFTLVLIIYSIIMQKRAAKLSVDTVHKEVIEPSPTTPKKQKEDKPTANTLNSPFLTILQRMKAERGFSIFEDYSKCNSLLKDYTAGEFKKESRLLLLAKAGCPGEIARSTEPEITKNKLINRLNDEYSMIKESAEQVVSWLYGVYVK
ncbi:MAG: hypothetical protein FWD47_04585 [Treponema sp.]|nr:hypothetical protein [Treponema sp.]